MESDSREATTLTPEPGLTMQEIVEASSQLARYSAGDFGYEYRPGQYPLVGMRLGCKSRVGKWGRCPYPCGTALLWKEGNSLLSFEIVREE